MESKNVYEEELISSILEEAIYVHKILGPGLLEKVYQQCLVSRLRKKSLRVSIEEPIPVYFDDIEMECGYRADIIVEDLIVIEVKRVESVGEIHIAQVLTYLRCLELRYGLILNFNTVLMKNGIKRVLNGY